MSAFQLVALLSPLLLGIFVPFLFALGREKEWTVCRRGAVLLVFLALWTLLLGGLWVASSEPFPRLTATLAFLGSWCGFLTGLFHALVGLRIPPFLSQVLCGFLVVLMVGTLFYFDPILEEAQGGTRESFQARVDIAMEWNPWVVMAYSIFEDDLLTHRSLYTRTLLADLPRTYPDWGRNALWYLALAGAFSLFYLGSTFLQGRFRDR